MEDKLVEYIVAEIRENRKDIKVIKDNVHELDKHIFSNKVKLSIFIGGFTLGFNMVFVYFSDEIKKLFS